MSRQHWNKQHVIDVLQDRQRRGLPINATGFGNISLVKAARRQFGNWLGALAAAGIGVGKDRE